LVERQHGGRLARLLGDVHRSTIFWRPRLNGYHYSHLNAITGSIRAARRAGP
jgi:hypothetical protein